MLQCDYIKTSLKFLQPAGTSRGVLHEKDSWFVRLWDSDNPETVGIGECSLIPGLSPDSVPGFEQQLKAVCQAVENVVPSDLSAFPAIRFGLETALRDLEQGGKRLLYTSDFTTGTTGIPINGLIWMGNKPEMLSRIAEKLDQGFSVLKMKVGALNFSDELEILRALRKEHPPAQLELRLDANGAWKPEEALDKLNQLSEYNIHSVEQPIAAGTPEAMARVCINSPIPIALDEELIGVHTPEQKEQLLATIKPHYIILKPSLLGGFSASEEWINLAEKQGTGWWVTSALESNIGLNAIAQWTATLDTALPQGLGTGSLFANNIPSPLTVTGSRLFYRPEKPWDLLSLKF